MLTEGTDITGNLVGDSGSTSTANDDTFVANSTTYNTNDVVVGGEGNDVLNLTATADVAATPTVVVETVNVNFDASLASGDTEFAFAADNITANAINLDVVATDSLVSNANIANIKDGVAVNLSDDFTNSTLDGVDNGSIAATFNANMNTTVTGATVDDVTLQSQNNVTLAASSNDGDLTVSGAVVGITAATAAGVVTVNATDDATITDATAASTLNVDAAGVASIIDANSATTMNVTTTGDEDANHNVEVTDGAAAAATNVTIVSAGSINDTNGIGTDPGNNAEFAAATTVSFTADDDSSVTADAATGATFASSDEDGVTFRADLATVDTLDLAGGNDLTVIVDTADLDTETVNNTNTGVSTLALEDSGSHDLSDVATSVQMRLASDFNARNTTVQSGAQILLDAEQAQTGTVTITEDTATATDNVLNLATTDTVTADTVDEIANVDALTAAEFQTINLEATDANIVFTGDLTATEATTFNVSGDENVTFTQVVGSSAGATVNAADLTGILTMTFDGTANAAETVISGSGADVINVGAATASGNALTFTTGAGNDDVVVTDATDITYNGGTGIDTITFDSAGALDVSGVTIDLTSVEQIDIDGTITVSSALVNGKTFLIDADDGDVANDVLDITMDDVNFDGSNLAFTSDFGAAGTDSVIIDGSGISLDQTITGTSQADEITTSGGNDSITAGAGNDTITSAGGNDTVDAGAGDDIINIAAGTNVLTGGDGDDDFVFTADTSANGASRILDFQSTEDLDITVGGTFNDLHTGDGAALAGALAGDVSASIGYSTGGAVALDAADNVLLFANTADGLDGINAALTAGSTTVIEESAGGVDFADGDELFVAVQNSTTGFVELGIVTIGGGDGFNGAGETYEHVATVETTGISSANVAGAIDFV